MNISQRMQSVQEPIIPVIRDLIQAHPGTISLGQGVAFYGPPPRALEGARTFGASVEEHKYSPVQGSEPLRELIRRKLSAENQVFIGADREVIVTAGGNMGFLNALFAILDPEDEVILPLPYYFNQEMAIRMLNGHPVTVPTTGDYQLDLQAIEAAVTARTRAIVTISPNNPTGAVYSEDALRRVNHLCRARGIYHISDEAYENFLYDGARHFSPASIDGSEGHTISLFSLSKAYGFASWRIGYMVIPAALFPAVLKAQDTNLICPPGISQRAAIGALETGPGYCREHLKTIARVRDLVLRELEPLRDACEIPQTQGAFYFLLRLAQAPDSLSVAKRLIQEHGVAVIPGCAFGVNDTCTLRVSYGALTPETAQEGIQRLVRGLRALVSEA